MQEFLAVCYAHVFNSINSRFHIERSLRNISKKLHFFKCLRMYEATCDLSETNVTYIRR